MNNENYYKNELEILIDGWLLKETTLDNDLGYLPAKISQRMAEAAFAVLENNCELNEFYVKEGLVK